MKTAINTSRFICRFLACWALFAAFSLSIAQAVEPESWLGLPVTFVDDGYTYHGGPARGLRDIKLHTTDPIQVNKGWVKPDWGAWITGGKTNRVRLDAEEIVAKPSALLRLGMVDGKTTHKLTGLHFTRLKLLLGANSITLPEGEMEFAEDGTLSHIRLAIDSFAKFDVVPKEGKLTVLMQTTGMWKWNVLSAVRFDTLVAQGDITDDGVTFDKIGGTGDGGSMEGVVRLTVTDKFQFDGDIELDKLKSADLLSRFFAGHTVQGALTAKVKFSAQGESLADAAKAVTASGTYHLHSGSIDRLGVLEGLRRATSGPAGGGLTKFLELDGSFSGATGKATSVTIRRLDGGAMQGSGSFQIANDGSLRGNLAAAIKLPNGDSKSRAMALGGRVNAPDLIVP